MGTPAYSCSPSEVRGWPSTYDWRLKWGQSCGTEPLNLWESLVPTAVCPCLNLIELNCVHLVDAGKLETGKDTIVLVSEGQNSPVKNTQQA